MSSSSTETRFEIVIVGGGPAGAATAIETSRRGYNTLLIDRSLKSDFKIGEGLPPAARGPLKKLGVWDAFERAGHLPCHGNESLWGSDSPHTTDFIRDPHGHGWHLDRLRFDQMLREAAVSAGAEFWSDTELQNVERSENGDTWQLDVVTIDGRRTIEADFVIDATGRAARVARCLGIRHQSDDHLTCHYALFRQTENAERDHDSLTRIESARDGWWYTALLPHAQRVVAYFTDVGTENAQVARQPEQFDRLLSETRALSNLVSEKRYERATLPRSTAANSGHLEQCCGSGWLAVGDAATSFDPLSSQGLYTSLYHGIMAAEAAHLSFSGDTAATSTYANQVESVYSAYLKNRVEFYAMEQRWSAQPFWASRIDYQGMA